MSQNFYQTHLNAMKNIKTILISATLLFFITQSYAQNILVADNNPGAPSGTHVYNTLGGAIAAAVAGDIIHVIPSATSYGTVEILEANDSISIIGIGFNPDKDGPQLSTVAEIRVSGSGIRIAGLTVTDDIYLGWTAGNYSGLAIENSDVSYINSNTSTAFSMSNVIVRNCIIYNQSTSNITGINFTNRVNNSIITNNIIVGYPGTSTSPASSINAYNGTIIKNNVFLGDGENNKYAFGTLQNCTVSNNIFFGRQPGSFTSNVNNVYNNNVSVGAFDNTLPPTGTNISGNNNVTSITLTTDVFTDANIIVNDNWQKDWDPTPSNAALLGTGTDGTDIGVTGSSIPFDITGTSLPYIQNFIVPEVIKQGDNLNVTVRAIGN